MGKQRKNSDNKILYRKIGWKSKNDVPKYCITANKVCNKFVRMCNKNKNIA